MKELNQCGMKVDHLVQKWRKNVKVDLKQNVARVFTLGHVVPTAFASLSPTKMSLVRYQIYS